MGLLAPGQARFAGALARETGLDPRVVAAWTLAEESGGAAHSYEGRGYHNWLNIANTDSGPAHGAHSSVWGDPLSAARATAEWLRGQGQIAREYGKPAAGIQRILGTKGAGAQISAIANSGWASSGYEHGNALRSLFHELGGEHIPVPAAGAGEIPNAGEGGGGGGAQPIGTSPAQIASLMQLLDGGQAQASSTSVEGFSPRKPTEQAEGAPRLPTPIAEVPKTSLTDALALIDQIGEQGEAARPASGGGGGEGEGEGGGGAAEPAGAGHEVNPLPGFSIGRTDMGVDANAKPGSPIRALGNAKVLGVSPNWYAGQPYIYYRVLNERGEPHPTSSFPDAGKVVYVAEQVASGVKAGDYLRAGQVIGRYASHGTGIEFGLGDPHGSSRTLAQTTTGYHEGQVTTAGRQALALLHRLGAR